MPSRELDTNTELKTFDDDKSPVMKDLWAVFRLSSVRKDSEYVSSNKLSWN